MLRPGVKESQIVAAANKMLYELGSDDVEAINAVAGERCSPQRDAYKQAREWIDAAIDLVRPGVGTDQIAAVFPKAEEFGFDDEMEAFALQFCHGLGVALHERPIVSRLVSLDNPQEIKEGMVFALETYCPASDGFSAARIEELPIANPY